MGLDKPDEKKATVKRKKTLSKVEDKKDVKVFDQIDKSKE